MKTYCIDFIVDMTASNEKNLPWIYFLMEEVVQQFLQYKTEKFVFGITTIRGGSENSQALTFLGGEDFTNDARQLLVNFMEVKTSRGDAQLVEQVDEAIQISLNKFKKSEDYLGIPVLITDCNVMPKDQSYFDYMDSSPVFHMLAFCSSNLVFHMRFLNAQGEEQNIEHISVKDYEQLVNNNAVDFIYQTIVTRIANETVGN